MIAVYEIVNTANKKRYIGSTMNFHQRCNKHRNDLIKGNHHCIYLQRAWDKYGESCFEFNIIETFSDIDSCRKAEQELLDTLYGSIYYTCNVSSGGDLISYNPNRATIVKRMTESVNKRYSNMSLEERKTLYGRKGKRNGMYGKKHSAETIAKIRKAKLGKPSANKGRRLSDEQRKRLSEVAKTRTGSKNAFYGKRHTDETKAKIAEAHKGVTPVNAKKVFADSVVYPSATACAKELNLSVGTICNRIKSKNYPSFYYVDEMPND